MMEILAAGDFAEAVGHGISRLLFIGLGLFLLVKGLKRRFGKRPAAPVPVGVDPSSYSMQAGYQPPPGYRPPPPAGYGPPPGFAPPPPPGFGPPSAYAPPMTYPPAAPRSSGGIAMIVLGAMILGVSVVALGASGRRVGHSDTLPKIVIGQCITWKAFAAERAHPSPVDCSGPDAVLELASKGDGSASCPDGKRSETGYALLLGSNSALCFVPNLREGHCYLVEDNARYVVPIDCTDPTATVKVARRLDNSTDASACDTDAKAIVFKVPQRVYCVVPPS